MQDARKLPGRLASCFRCPACIFRVITIMIMIMICVYDRSCRSVAKRPCQNGRWAMVARVSCSASGCVFCFARGGLQCHAISSLERCYNPRTDFECRAGGTWEDLGGPGGERRAALGERLPGPMR
jgi:hypothetical protein